MNPSIDLYNLSFSRDRCTVHYNMGENTNQHSYILYLHKLFGIAITDPI